MRSLWTATKSSPCLPQLEKSLRSNEDPAHSQKEINERNCMCIYVCVCISIYKQIDMTIPERSTPYEMYLYTCYVYLMYWVDRFPDIVWRNNPHPYVVIREGNFC